LQHPMTTTQHTTMITYHMSVTTTHGMTVTAKALAIPHDNNIAHDCDNTTHNTTL